METDLIIYVTNQNRCEGDNLASSLFCASDALTNRPVAGAIDFCNFGRHRFENDLMVAVHEMIHILVCSQPRCIVCIRTLDSLNSHAQVIVRQASL